jgi:hypothetical protein
MRWSSSIVVVVLVAAPAVSGGGLSGGGEMANAIRLLWSELILPGYCGAQAWVTKFGQLVS